MQKTFDCGFWIGLSLIASTIIPVPYAVAQSKSNTSRNRYPLKTRKQRNPVAKAKPSKAKPAATAPVKAYRGNPLVPLPADFQGYPPPTSVFWPQLDKAYRYGDYGIAETYEQGKPGVPPGDPLSDVTTDSRFRGRLFYVAKPVVNGQADLWHYIFRGVGGLTGQYTDPQTGRKSEVDAVSFPTFWGFDIWRPEFSPDGRYAYARHEGDVLDCPGIGYTVVLWDLEHGKVNTPGLFSWPQVALSTHDTYFAFIRGGSPFGEEDLNRVHPNASLRIYYVPYISGFYPLLKLDNGQSVQDQRDLGQRLISSNQAAVSFAWADDHTLLYCRQPKGPISAWQYQENITRYVPNVFSDIWETDVSVAPANAQVKDGQQPLPSKLLIRNGYDPVPSPQQRWIAFSGWPEGREKTFKLPDPKEARYEDYEMTTDRIADLYLFDRQSGKRVLIKALNRQEAPSLAPELLWTADGKKLVMLIQHYEPSADVTDSQMQIWTFDFASYQKLEEHLKGMGREVTQFAQFWKQVTSLPQHEFEFPLVRGLASMQVQNLSQNGQFLYLTVDEDLSKERSGETKRHTLLAIDLSTGERHILARLKDYQNLSPGLAWREEPLNPQ